MGISRSEERPETETFFSVAGIGFVNPEHQTELIEILKHLGEIGLSVSIDQAPLRLRDDQDFLLANLGDAGWVITRETLGKYGKRMTRTAQHGTTIFDSLSQHLTNAHSESSNNVCSCALRGGIHKSPKGNFSYVDPLSFIRAFNEGSLGELHLPFTGYAKNPIPLRDSVVYGLLTIYAEKLQV